MLPLDVKSSHLSLLSLQPFCMSMFLIHIHVLTHVNVPISMGHVTTQNKHYFAV